LPTVALDLLGGDGAPEIVADAVALLLSGESPGEPVPELIVVGPPELARDLMTVRGVAHERVEVVAAGRAVGMDEDPLGVIRAHEDVSVTVAARLVARGRADAWVSVGHTGAAVAAAVLELGRLAGMSRPALAVVVPALAGPVVLLDVGAAPDATPDLLRQFAVAGCAYAESLGICDPGVGLLTIGGEAGKGDRLRRSGHELLEEVLPPRGVRYVGPVEGHDVALGRRAQVVVTDGFTGNVLLKGLEGAVQWSAARIGQAYPDASPAWQVVVDTATSDFAGGMLLGVDGVTVVGHGAGTAEEIGACVRLAARAATRSLVTRAAGALAGWSA
jgi:glycerol-3-phosphate acyltransferase PlsX